MSPFRLDYDAVRAERRQASTRAADAATMAAVLASLEGRERLAPVDAVALLLSPHVATATLERLAAARPRGPRPIETFAPLYVTNECDAECRMCGMRSTNAALVRETAAPETVEAQLDVLHRRGLRAVAVLTGEYAFGPRRRAMILRAASAVRAALGRGFRHVLVNIGSLEDEELRLLLADLPTASDGTVVPQVTMCTFQETYDPGVYGRFMGENPRNPRADYGRRLTNFDRARAAGMWAANPGVLLGLNPDVGFEVLALVVHVAHLAALGMRVYVSLPRLRRASGTPRTGGVDDDGLARIVAVLGFAAPEARIVISTRESPTVQARLLPMIHVLTPGSPGVAPYTATGARFELEASQFEVLDHRPFEGVLGDVLAAGYAVDCYEPAPAG
jgi:2-iminoacetate synthase